MSKLELKQLIYDLYNSPIFTGFAGALASVLFAKEKLSFWRRLAHIIVGSLVASYIAPAVIDWMGIENERVQLSFTFIVGVIGVGIIAALINWLQEFKKDPGAAFKSLRNIWRR